MTAPMLYTNLGRSHPPLHVDVETGRVTVGARYVHVPPVEFRLLTVLWERVGVAVTYAQIAQHTTAGSQKKIQLDIARLREAIGDDPRSPHYITSVRGVGYRLEPDAVTPRRDPLAAYEVVVTAGRLALPCPHDGCAEDLLATNAAPGGLTRMRELAAWHELNHWAEAS
ncbi:winged helix-turn-helix domain-containing protein [Streptosporangium sp. NBC_01755]|uniref:winged helix-turn-helix domain-containing protein n=1 Tax=Streptosporangium sp. NBC_01755 TaxID=2975949 RepID=UPI002DD977EC|nr:winged helix-turn-helix domain-containing protein [Streptosporangium sp. NBC_01755]WSD01492.1 winged helix-turn-helix domain-containing protein [Streptosporangium sp. NBC_01755]WSD03792.1 winged helix-turn-helix domain-containing protein [Streptosporangium sp. NBC_01755]